MSKCPRPTSAPWRRASRTNAKDFSRVFSDYTIRDAEDATPDEVVAAIWTCYHEAAVAKPVIEQHEQPRPFSSVASYLTKVVQIVIGVAGVGTVLGLIFKSQLLGNAWEAVRGWAEGGAEKLIPSYSLWNSEAKLLLWSGLVYLLLWLVIFIGKKRVQVVSGSYPVRSKSTLGPLSVAAWLVVQLVHSLPIVLYCLLSPILSSPLVAIAVSAVSGLLQRFYAYSVLIDSRE